MKELGADLILHGGKVITVDSDFSIAEAVAIVAGRIAAVGNDAEVGGFAGRGTRSIDLAGKTVMPGLIDGHAHMDREGLKDVYPSLEGARSIDDILERISGLVRSAEPGDWIVTMPIGDPPYYWDVPNNLKERRFPTRWDLDRVSPNNPVYIRSIWGFWRHIQPLVSIANSRALELAGITRDSLPPCGSVQIEKDFATGQPNGIFIEWTFVPIVELSLMREAGGFTHEDRVKGLRKAMRIYNAAGTTSVFEEHGVAAELLKAYQEVHRDGGLSVRSNLVFSPAWNVVKDTPLSTLFATWSSWLGAVGLGDSFLRVGGLITEIDTSDENRVRAQASPYTGWSGFNYDSGLPRHKVKEVMVEAARNNIRMIGIWPNLLDLYEEVDRIIPISDRRWILGHINVLSDDDVKRIRDLGLVLTTHTNRYIYKEGHLTLDRLGSGREDSIVPLRKLRDAGVRFSLATDNVPVSMFHPIWHSVARLNRYTECVIAPSQKLSREEALRAATIDGAYLTFEENEKGSIEVGKLADLVVLSDDPLEAPEDALKDIVSELTIVDGKVVYQADGS